MRLLRNKKPRLIATSEPQESKTFIEGFNCNSTRAINFQQQSGLFRPLISTYIRHYQSIAPLGDAVDLIANQFAQIIPKVFDTKTKEFADEHPALDLLRNPNTNVSYCELAESEASFFELTGNHYWIVTLSGVDSKPLELFSIPPQWINYTIGQDGRVDNYIYAPHGQSIQFDRVNDGRRIRYLQADGKAELFLLKRFNPNAEGFYFLGMSKLNSIFYELMQYRLASVHNQSLLESGGRPSGMLTSPQDLTKAQLNFLRSEFETVFSGASNAGRPLIGANLNWEDFTVNNRDMDFATLKIQLKEMIYNRFKIPLALINSTALSLANMTVAMLQLYDLAILPMATKIFGSLTLNLLPLYDNSENLIITFDPCTIPPVKDRTIEQVTAMAALNVMSDNEMRNKLDLPDREGGDEIFKPSTSVPVGDAENMSNVIDDNDDGDDDADESATQGS